MVGGPSYGGEDISVLETFRIDGRVAVVTGGAGRIGTGICEALAQAGATVVVASRDLERCEQVAKSILKDGGSAVAMRLDLADQDSIREFHGGVVDTLGSADVLVNNAISSFPGHIEDYPIDDWEASLRVDATGWFRITQLFLQTMIAHGAGNIINVASILGMVAPDERLYPSAGLGGFRPSYFFVKAGVINFTRFLAVTYADRNIRANCLSPGGVETEPPRADAVEFVARTPMRRLASPQDLQGGVLFLASDASRYVTGHNLVIDGGYTAW